MYFATEDYSLATFILVNGGLSFLFAEVGMQKASDLDAEENFKLCRENFLYGLSRFNILTAPTVENLQALLLGVGIHPAQTKLFLTGQATYAIQLSQPSLCWALTSHAARLCQSLGLHRSAKTSPDDTKESIVLKKRIFWLTYILDKSLSLRMGHSSILQDFDITLDLPELSADSRMSMWDILHRQWVKVGYFQGRIYEELYSPRALSEPESTRTRRARAIAEEMQTWYQEILRVCLSSS